MREHPSIHSSPPPTISELELALAQRRERKADDLRPRRVEIFSRISMRLQDLRLPFHPTPHLEDFERGPLAWVAEIRRSVEEGRDLERGWVMVHTQTQREQDEAKTAYEGADSLTQAIEKHRHLETFLTKRMEAEVYAEAIGALREDLRRTEDSLEGLRGYLTEEGERYVARRCELMREEMERQLDRIAGTVREIQALKGRISQFPGEFSTKYGIAVQPRKVVIDPKLPTIPELKVSLVTGGRR